MSSVDTALFHVKASLNGVGYNELAIEQEELARARHALAFLKQLIGNERMRELLASDIEQMKARARDWVAASGGRWRTGVTELVVPGPSAAAFQQWYDCDMAERQETALRAGHPEHFVLSPGEDRTEVVENIGETELPWRIFYRSLPEDQFPVDWDPALIRLF